ncbi:MAG: hypothetical protein ACYSYV_06980 [Planctomycetota bacterium]
MSTLTKVLIVLLTIASIFLCGIVVTYVASAVDYKGEYDKQNRLYQAARENEGNANTQLNNTKKEMEQQKAKLNEEIGALQVQAGELQNKLIEVEREKALLLQKVNNWTSIVKDFTQTNDKQGQLLQNALDELNKVQTELIKERKELKDTTTALIEKMAIIALLENKSKGLLEEKTALQNKLDQFLRQYGKAIAAPVPVTTTRGQVRVAPPTKDIGLRGLITVVDLKNLLAEISIGAADGVKEGMRFHATRGDKFICDIVILDVEPEKAVGWLELLQKNLQDQPRAGDNVSTNL